MKGTPVLRNGSRKKTSAVFALALLACTALAQRAPTVTYTATGFAGAWDLEFTLTNNLLPGEGDIYFFGVDLETGRNILSSPSGWDCNRWREWTNSGFGGSGRVYDNVWVNLYSRPDDVRPKFSLSTWRARSTETLAPTTVNFFAFAAEGAYFGNDHFSEYWNPGFEGMATLVSVPEPTSAAVFGFGALILVRRRKAK